MNSNMCLVHVERHQHLIALGEELDFEDVDSSS